MKNTPRAIEIIFVLLAFCLATLVLSFVPGVLSGEAIEYSFINITDTIPLAFKIDAAGLIFACVSGCLYIPVSFYAIGYMRAHEKEDKGLILFYSCFAICVFSAVGIAFSANLITFFIFFEILTIATWPLVFHERNDEAIFSGRKYLIYTLIPGQLLLVGIIIVYSIFHTVDFVPGGYISLESASPVTLWVIFIFLFLAGATKAGMMPFHGWLPSAMVAPTPVSALLHAVAVVKAGAFCVVRIVGYVFTPEALLQLGISHLVSVLAGFTIICASLIALRQDNLKKRLAYSTVGQLSYIILGMMLLNPYGMTGGLFHIVAHAVMKITLFMCAGAIIVTSHKTNISQLNGLGRKMPITFVCFTIASLGIAGMPFIAGFISKWNLGLGSYHSGHPIYIFILIGSALLSLSYLLPVTYIAFFKKCVETEPRHDIQEASGFMLIPIIITTLFSVILGTFPNAFIHLFDMARMASNLVLGGF